MSNPVLKNPGSICLNKIILKKNIFSFLFTFFISITILQAQCLNTGYNNATNFITDNTIGIYNFSSPGNAQTSDNSRAVATSLIAILSGDTYYLKATGFNFSIPSYASICGITVQIEHRATGLLFTAAVRDKEVKLIKNGTITGNNKASATNWGTSDSYATYGGSSDLWGTTLTPADVNASNFGIAISASIIALVVALPTAEIDHIQMSIDYNPTLPVTLLYFRAKKNNSEVNLEWRTGEEEDNAFIQLQRSQNNSVWQDLARFEMHAINSQQIYRYTDKVNEEGTYSYRLKTTLGSGQFSFSAINKIVFTGTGNISLYPSPARDFIIIENTENAETIFVFNQYFQNLKLPLERTGTNSWRLSIQKLSKGIYFATAGNQTIKFLKE